MPRIRTIKPDLWEDEKIGSLSALARLNFVGLISLADDDGRGRGSTAWLLTRLHPYSTKANEKLMKDSLNELRGAGVVIFYEVHGQTFYQLKNFGKHQQISHPRESKFPPVPETPGHLPEEFKVGPECSGHVPEESGHVPDGMEWNGSGNGKGMERTADAASVRSSGFEKPTLAEVEAFIEKKKLSVNAEAWYAYYESNGWKVGKNPMKKWKPAVWTWELREGQNGKAQ